MAAEQIGPRGRVVLLRNTVHAQSLCTAQESQAVSQAVVYSDEPYRQPERASSDLKRKLRLVFLKHAAHRGQPSG